MNGHRIVRIVSLPLLVVAALSLGCGKEEHGLIPPETFPGTSVSNSLVFKGADSLVVTMGTTPFYCCGRYDPSFVNERAMRIVLYDPANQNASWQILILIDRAQPGATTTLPTAVVAPSKAPYVSMFVSSRGGEWSSDVEESSGAIVVHSFRCSATTIQVDFSVDAVLGSELAGGSSMRVQGTFQATFPAHSCS